jgi:hypothetical protein
VATHKSSTICFAAAILAGLVLNQARAAAGPAPITAARRVLVRPGSGALHIIPKAADLPILLVLLVRAAGVGSGRMLRIFHRKRRYFWPSSDCFLRDATLAAKTNIAIAALYRGRSHFGAEFAKTGAASFYNPLAARCSALFSMAIFYTDTADSTLISSSAGRRFESCCARQSYR